MGVSTMNVVGDGGLVDLYVTHLLPSGLPSIVHKKHGTLIVLEHLIISHINTLCLQEGLYPQHKGHCIIYPN